MNTMHLALAALSLLAAAGSADAQTPDAASPRRALPSGFGDTSNRYPFGEPSLEYQQVHSSWSFTDQTPTTITGIYFTPDNVSQPARVEIEMWMAKSPHGMGSTSRVFADNEVASTRVQVVNRKFITLPATRGPWSLFLPFDRPFSWDGGHLSWRVRVHGNDQGNAVLRYTMSADSARNRATQTGSFGGCTSNLGNRTATHYGSLRATGEPSYLSGLSGVPNTVLPGVLTFGLSATQLGGAPLPLDMTSLGAGGCQITNDVQAAIPFNTESNPYGNYTVQLEVPDQPSLVGQRLYTQAFFVQPGANDLGVFASPGATHTVPNKNGVARVFSGRGATSGGVSNLFGVVVGLRTR